MGLRSFYRQNWPVVLEVQLFSGQVFFGVGFRAPLEVMIMNKKFALFLACCVVGGLAASCNDTVEWGFQEENCLEGTVVCDSNAVKTCKNGV